MIMTAKRSQVNFVEDGPEEAMTAKMETAELFANVALAEELIAHPATDRLFIDVRLGDPEEELTSFRTCHVFGAIHAQIREVFAAPPTPATGNLPLPSIASLQRHLDGWGVGEETEIIVYGPTPALAARGWWVLKWAGFQKVRLLDGGLTAWMAAGGAVAQGDEIARGPASKPVPLSAGHMPTIEAEEVERLNGDVTLIDARDEASYLAGCIPRAQNLPASDQWTPARKLRPLPDIRQLYADADVRPNKDNVVVYCGGGVLSALEVLTMAAAIGVAPRLYVGSWSEWNKSFHRLAQSAEYNQQLVR
jgi:thiosulfate/3-mercaptopyruvate sulfurtransferase